MSYNQKMVELRHEFLGWARRSFAEEHRHLKIRSSSLGFEEWGPNWGPTRNRQGLVIRAASCWGSSLGLVSSTRASFLCCHPPEAAVLPPFSTQCTSPSKARLPPTPAIFCHTHTPLLLNLSVPLDSAASPHPPPPALGSFIVRTFSEYEFYPLSTLTGT